MDQPKGPKEKTLGRDPYLKKYLALESSSPPEPGADRTIRSPMPALAKIITFTNHMATMSTPARPFFCRGRKRGKPGGGGEIKAKPRPLLFFAFPSTHSPSLISFPKNANPQVFKFGEKRKKRQDRRILLQDGCSPVNIMPPSRSNRCSFQIRLHVLKRT